MINVYAMAYNNWDSTYMLFSSRDGWLSFKDLFETASAEFQVG